MINRERDNRGQDYRDREIGKILLTEDVYREGYNKG